MNVTIKIFLKDKVDKQGLYPVVLRIIKDRKTKIITLPFKCRKEEWDEPNSIFKKGYGNFRQANILLTEKRQFAEKLVYDFELEKIDFTLSQFEEQFRGKKEGNQTVKQFWSEKITNLIKAKRVGNARVHKDTMNSFMKFVNRDNLMFREIDAKLLDKYETYLRSAGGTDGGIGVKMREIRALFNEAMRQKVVAEKYYPFNDYKISRLKGKGHKKALTREEVHRIENLNVNKFPHLKEARDLFVFSYYCRGMNFYDIMKLRWIDINETHITYTRSKTKGNFKVAILKPIQDILDDYKQSSKSIYVFPILLSEMLTPEQIENRKAKKLKKFNRDLREIARILAIEGTVTSYVARHSFATNVRDAGGSVEKISQAMGHTNIAITAAYLKEFDNDEIDDLTRSLLRESVINYQSNKGAA